jgi:hypothetical protein
MSLLRSCRVVGSIHVPIAPARRRGPRCGSPPDPRSRRPSRWSRLGFNPAAGRHIPKLSTATCMTPPGRRAGPPRPRADDRDRRGSHLRRTRHATMDQLRRPEDPQQTGSCGGATSPPSPHQSRAGGTVEEDRRMPVLVVVSKPLPHRRWGLPGGMVRTPSRAMAMSGAPGLIRRAGKRGSMSDMRALGSLVGTSRTRGDSMSGVGSGRGRGPRRCTREGL